MRVEEIDEIVEDFGKAVHLAIKAGFDAVEIHAGHGYLISQFLSPYTNHRKDEYGGSLENRMRFMERVMKEVMAAASDKVVVFVKINTPRRFLGGGMRSMIVSGCGAFRLQELCAHALVLSGGFVSRMPMYVVGGAFPVKAIAHYMPPKHWWLKLGVRLFGHIAAPSVPFKENYFLKTPKNSVKHLTSRWYM